MEGIGAEVGQKMRSAIKAKLLELSCYVDDELPDYIMVMVANKRTKSQMNEDLNLFLSTQTSTFVDWLHIVLKKLKEVTVTNPEVYKKATKRKSDKLINKVKEENKILGSKRSKQTTLKTEDEQSKSLTDNLPLNVNRLSEQRKITIMSDSKISENSFVDGFDIPLLSEVSMSSEKDLEEIEKKIRNVKSRLGLLVDSDLEEELPIQMVKGEKVERKQISRSQKFESVIHKQKSPENSNMNNEGQDDAPSSDITLGSPVENKSVSEKKREHTRIIFEKDILPKRSILDRLGQRSEGNSFLTKQKAKVELSDFRKGKESTKYLKNNKHERRDRHPERDWKIRMERSQKESRDSRRDCPMDRKRNSYGDMKSDNSNVSVLSRLEVMSKVSVPRKEIEPEPEDELKTREVRSMVQVKPRVIPVDIQQPNKNLLLKAVAEAQRSVAQTPNVGNSLKADALLLKQYEEAKVKNKDKMTGKLPFTRKLSQTQKNRLRSIILEQAIHDKSSSSEDGSMKDEEEYIPKSMKNALKETPSYIPSLRPSEEGQTTKESLQQQFIVTLDGMEEPNVEKRKNLAVSIKSRLDKKPITSASTSSPIKHRLDKKRSPSPIVFDKINTVVKKKSDIPDKLPIIHLPFSIKNKERCRYWPSCRQGDKCEFVHPSTNCEKFPYCKNEDLCLFLHPSCKFGSSCTKRDCPYSHKTVASRRTSTESIKIAVPTLQTCKFSFNCANINCPFYHPKPCKFGKYCKNQAGCNFSHKFIGSKSGLTWRSKK